MNSNTVLDQVVDLSIAGSNARWDVGPFTRCVIQVVPHTGTLSSGVLTVQRAIDPDAFVAMPSATNIGSAGITVVDVEDIAWLQVVVTTTQAAKVKVVAYMNDYQGA